MTLCCAVYGYECTTPVRIGRFDLEPKYKILPEAHEMARDKTKYNLTALIIGDQIDDLLAFRQHPARSASSQWIEVQFKTEEEVRRAVQLVRAAIEQL